MEQQKACLRNCCLDDFRERRNDGFPGFRVWVPWPGVLASNRMSVRDTVRLRAEFLALLALQQIDDAVV